MYQSLPFWHQTLGHLKKLEISTLDNFLYFVNVFSLMLLV